MRFFSYLSRTAGAVPRLGAWRDGQFLRLADAHDDVSAVGLLSLLQAGGDAMARADQLFARHGVPMRESEFSFLPPVPVPPKILCVGLNYRDHTAESGFEQPPNPTIFGRFASSLAAHGQAILRPACSEQLDFEGELVLVIGKPGRQIRAGDALDHVAGYAIGNEASVRDYQFKSSQWTLGKNFDATAAVGPLFVTADELPRAASGLKLEARLNGEVVQSAYTDQMLFEIPEIIACVSEAMTLEAGTVIFTGTPAGVGLGRKPPLWMKAGDVVQVEIEGIGRLVNPVCGEEQAERPAAQPSREVA